MLSDLVGPDTPSASHRLLRLIRRALARLLRSAANVADRPVQQTVGAKGEQAESEAQQQQTMQHLVGELKIPESVMREYSSGERKKRQLEWWQFWVSVATLIGVFGYTTVAYKQWRQMISSNNLTQQSVEISRKALDANERAHLFSRIVRFYVAEPEHLPAAIFEMKNYGKSPAYSVRYGIACGFEKGRPQIAQPYLIDLTVPPTEVVKDLKAKCWNTPKIDADAMRAGARPFYIWLLVLYRDPFKIDGDRSALECWYKQDPKSGFSSCEPGSNAYSQ